MKNQGPIPNALVAATAALVCATPFQASAQNIGEVMPKGIKAMKQGKFAEAQQVFSEFTENFGMERGTRLFGGHFGSAYYYQGRAELSLASNYSRLAGAENAAKAKEFFQKAKASFANSYSIAGEGKKVNKQQKLALLYKAQACQALGEYREAIDGFNKFLKERGKNDKFSIGMYHVNLAICHFRLPKPELQAGMTAFETALKNRERWKISDTAIVNAFQAFSQAVITSKNESAMVDFLNQNRAVLTLKPFQMAEFTPFFQKLASEAIRAEMVEAGFNLLGLVPSTELAIADIKELNSRIENLPQKPFMDGKDTINPARLAQTQATLEKRVAAGDPPEVMALSTAAVVHEQNGYLRGAYAIYDQLERYHSKNKRREANLYHLFRLASTLGREADAEKHGRLFIKTFPKSERVAAVQERIIGTSFVAGDYEKTKSTVNAWIDTIAKGTNVHDLALYALANSYFYTGEYDKAEPVIAEHVKTYPDSEKRKVHAFYVYATTVLYMQQLDEAQKRLEAFIAKYPDAKQNIYLPNALFDLANVHFMKQEFDKSITYLDRIEKEFSSAKIAGAAFNLKGSILQSQEGEDKALAYFKKSLEMAQKEGNSGAEAESLFYLISLLGDSGAAKAAGAKQEDVLPFFDLFWKKHQNTPYLPNVATSASEALAAAGRYDVLLEALKKAIPVAAKGTNTIVLVTAIENYSKYFMENEVKKGASEVDAAEKLRLVYYKFPNVDPKDARTQAMLRVALIGVYEETYQHAVTAKDEDLKGKMEGRITTTFKDLKDNYPPAQLSDFVLVKIGDYLRTKSAAPRQAIPFYAELVKRGKGEYFLDAEFGLADVYGVAGNAKEVAGALKSLASIEKSNPDDKEIGGKAKSRIVQIYAKQQNWAKVIESGNEYTLAYRKDKNQRLAVQQLLAKAYDTTKDYANAIKQYTLIFGANTSNWAVSVPAISRSTQLTWDHSAGKDGKSGKQVAYEVAARYIKSSRPAFDKFKDQMSDDVRSAWRSLDRRVQQWEESGQIKTFAQQEAEQKNG